MLNKRLLASCGLVLSALLLMAAYNRPYRWWPFNDMAEQMIIKPFTENSLRAPAEGSVAVDQWEPVPTKMDLLTKPGEYADFKNPVSASDSSIKTGEKLYNMYCLSCHGPEMTPDPERRSEVQKRGMPGANILLVGNYSDEHIYSVITHGSAIMKRQSYNLDPEERWHVVNYIRSLANRK